MIVEGRKGKRESWKGNESGKKERRGRGEEIPQITEVGGKFRRRGNANIGANSFDRFLNDARVDGFGGQNGFCTRSKYFVYFLSVFRNGFGKSGVVRLIWKGFSRSGQCVIELEE